MRKYIILIITTLFLSSCTYNPDKRSNNIIKTKELINSQEVGKYKYFIETDFCIICDMILYSDSNWNVGDTLKIIKQ